MIENSCHSSSGAMHRKTNSHRGFFYNTSAFLQPRGSTGTSMLSQSILSSHSRHVGAAETVGNVLGTSIGGENGMDVTGI